MSAFFVGQRVRLVRPGNQKNWGKQGRITALFPERDGLTYRINCTLQMFDELPALTSPNTHTSRLEPILPEGMKPARWEDCIWQPEGVTA